MKINFNRLTIKETKGSEPVNSLNVTLTDSSADLETQSANAKPVALDTDKLTEEENKVVSDFVALLKAKSE